MSKIEGEVSNKGLKSTEAILKLKIAIEDELDRHQKSTTSLTLLPPWVRDAFYHESNHATFTWTTIFILTFQLFLLVIYAVYADHNFRRNSLLVEVFFLILILLANVFIVAWDSRLRHTEMMSRIRCTVKQLEDNRSFCMKSGSYYDLHTPQSPCISQQWTYRDGHLCNLPWSLLVEGDIILMRPGHFAPGKCKELLNVQETGGSSSYLKRGQIFAPTDEKLSENFNSPRLRKPAQPARFVMLETPCIDNVRCSLENALIRPVTLFNKEYHAVVFYYMERIVLPSTIIVMLCIGSIRAVYFETKSTEWADQLLLRPVLVMLPTIPVALPVLWILLNAIGNSYLIAIVNSKQCLRPVDPFEEISPSTLEKYVKWSDLKVFFCSLLLGQGGYLWRSANLLQVLGSITALCCVDKKGILSWPNPTAEKVFFLKSPRSKSNSEMSTQSCAETENPGNSEQREDIVDDKKLRKFSNRLDVKDHIFQPGSQVEVLDLTHNLHSPFGIQFDDPNWKFYADNLKPLGLGILLNTCNPKVQEHYTQFSDHIACESLYNESAVPVVNKRCLCELAKQIGFTESVIDFYDLEKMLGIFRHVHPEIVQKGKLARSLNFPRLKMPFPNMSCAILKDLHRGSNQLFSQGTADLILDACNEYWDGNDIHVLTDSDRKRILDFYHRSSLTAHCMGFAYSPLNNNDVTKDFSESYVELPSKGYNLFSSLEITTSSPRSWNPPNNDGCRTLNHCLSSDSLILPEAWNLAPLHQLGSEIFIGMVTMQYQACPDFVQLIEQFDKASIRFVHFSKENELRSRVFSEKMGLESGWNCHISLLSDETSPKSDIVNAVSPFKFTQHYNFPGTLEEDHSSEQHHKVPMRYASAPNIVQGDASTMKSEEISNHIKTDDSISSTILSRSRAATESLVNSESQNCIPRKSASSLQDFFGIEENMSNSPSHVTESTDQSAPVTFDMSNRAKLPKGTENIRPHIENVDNVPLQVSLFTDCTVTTTREMICIMQEYGEVVCCLGSSSNSENTSVFLQADASIAIEPLLPQVCNQHSMYEGPEQRILDNLSSMLNSLPCAIFFHREDPISLYHLIMEARHFMCNVRNGLEFLLCSYLSLILLQVLGVLFFLPVPLPPTHLLWMICLEIPLLSLSLLGNPIDSQVMTLATGKNLKVANKQAILFFIACFCAKFSPSVVVALFSFACILSSACHVHLEKESHMCWISYVLSEEENISSDSWFAVLTVSQNVMSFFFILYFVIISMSFIHRSHLLWKSNPFANKYWLMAVAFVLFLHLIFCIIDIILYMNKELSPNDILWNVPYYVWLLCCLWPFIVIPLNELIKHHEIKINVRQQKRARLEFCTKLGMNSPF